MNKILIDEDAVKRALEALEAGEYYIDDLEAIVYAADDIGVHEDRAKMQAAITTLRKALAEQPAQRTWVGLTDDERGLLVIEHLGPNALLHKPMSIYDAFHMGIDAAEAAHSIKEKP